MLLLYLRNAAKVPPNAYNYTSPESWPNTFPMCGGPMQSPIALTPTRLKFVKAPALQFADNLENGMIEAENTGREIKLKLLPPNTEEPLLNFFSFNGETLGIYEFAQMHFHWGDVRLNHGSEHASGENFTDAEAHFVFYNSPLRQLRRGCPPLRRSACDWRAAQRHGRRQLRGPVPHAGNRKADESRLQPGEEAACTCRLAAVPERAEACGEDVHELPRQPDHAACNPVVSWMVAAKPMLVSEKFLETLQTSVYEDDDGTDLLVNNCRPLQPEAQKSCHTVHQLQLDDGSCVVFCLNLRSGIEMSVSFAMSRWMERICLVMSWPLLTND